MPAVSSKMAQSGNCSVTGSYQSPAISGPGNFGGEASVVTSRSIIAAQDEQLVLVGRLTPGGDVGVGATIAARKVLTQ